MTHSARVEIVHRFDAPGIDGRRWNELVLRSETNTVFQTYEWFSAWHNIFGDQYEIWLILVFIDDELAGIAPLARRGRTLRFATVRHADYCDIIAAEHKHEVIRLVLQFLAERQDAWRALELHNIPGRSSTVSLLKTTAAAVGLHTLVRGTVACPTIELNGITEDTQRLLRKNSLKRPYRFMHQHGPLEFRNVTDLDAAHALLPRFFDQHIDRWRAGKSQSLFQDGNNQRFYQELVRHLLPCGWLVFSVVEYNGEPAAFHIGFDYGASFLWYKPSFDIRLQKHSPGSVMLRFLLEQAMQRGKKEFDFTVGDEAFKRRYCNAIRYNTNVLVAARMRPYVTARIGVYAKRAIRFLLGRRGRTGR